MKLKIKLFVVFSFLAFAACVFLFSDNRSQAQSGKTDNNRAEILQKVADYKSWKQVRKPENQTDAPVPVLNPVIGG